MMESKRLYLRNTLARLLDNCLKMNELKRIHTHIITSPFLLTTDRYFLISRLIFFCCVSESGSLSYAANAFRLVSRPSLFMYNAMIRAHASKNTDPTSCQALVLYKRLLFDEFTPDFITLPFVLKECVNRVDAFAGLSVHGHAVKFGLHSDIFIQNSLISMYSGCGLLDNARRVFDEMPNRDVVSWNSMVVGCLRNGELDLALELFRNMKKRNIITWNSIITGFVQGGRGKEALGLFHEMQISGGDVVISPDKITIANVISACASLGAIDHGRWVHSFLKRSKIECDTVIATALVDMYGKCGCVDKALEVFTAMPKKDVLAWTSMISVFSLHGNANQAFELFSEMEAAAVKPNSVTFTALLSVCAHSGLVEKGRWFFNAMRSVYSLEPQLQHYACMVDLLGRAGLFDETEVLIRSMPMEPDVFVWGALLGGCQMHRNFQLGEKVAQYLIALEPQNHAFYVNLCDIYAKAGKFDHVKKVRAFMNSKGIAKTAPGCSMIEIDGVVHEFSVRGSPEDLLQEIKPLLDALSYEMKRESHIEVNHDLCLTVYR
nr:pentatricopeptide repeat-containing protein At5g66520-like [Ipomoea batatas]